MPNVAQPAGINDSRNNMANAAGAQLPPMMPPPFSLPPFIPFGKRSRILLKIENVHFCVIDPSFPCLAVPPPRPPANLGALSDAELQAMEGQERRHLEARIRVLRDIQTLLDAAVLQMNQYGALVARLEQETINNNNNTEAGRNVNEEAPAAAAAPTAQQPAEPAEATSSAGAEPPEEGLEALTAEEETNLSDQERLRRRRLQRFMNGVEQNWSF